MQNTNRQSMTQRALVLVILMFSGWVHATDQMAADLKLGLDSILTIARSADADTEGLADHIDFASITRGVLGKHRQALNPEQTARFQGEFEKSMFNLLHTATKTAGDFSIEITQTKISDKRPDTGQAYADIHPQKGTTIPVIASVIKGDSGWKVRNLIFDGVNLGLTYRNQFDQLMQSHQGDPDKAIDAWTANTLANTP